MSYFKPSNVYCQQPPEPPVKITAYHMSVPMTVLCPSNINSNFIQWIYIILKYTLRVVLCIINLTMYQQ